MSQRFALPAPGKLNLFLHVLGRRSDGYHELETLFVFLDRADTVTLEPRDDGVIERVAGPATVAPDDDLCVRAAAALRAQCGHRGGVRVTLEKRLPIGGGLGGGSSDAASVLVGLNQLWGCGLDEDALAGIGAELGADVPVFVRGRAAFGRGVGEQLAPVALARRWYLVAVPPVAVSTAAVFADHALTRNTKPLKIRDFPWRLDSDSAFDAMWRESRNDCESVVFGANPAIAAAHAMLEAQAPARLTGTGGCVFAVFSSRQAATAAQARCTGELQTFVAEGLDRSPLLAAVRSMHGTTGV